jgi:hypothetical protein
MDLPTTNSKEYKRLWRLKNKEKIQEYNAKYFQDNKEKILRKRNETEQQECKHAMYLRQRVECICGKELLRSSLYGHRKICIIYKQSNL